MIIGNMINQEISGFYDNGGEYLLSISMKNEFAYNKIKEMLKKNKVFKIEFIEDDFRIKLESTNLKSLYNFLKSNCINLKLETI